MKYMFLKILYYIKSFIKNLITTLKIRFAKLFDYLKKKVKTCLDMLSELFLNSKSKAKRYFIMYLNSIRFNMSKLKKRIGSLIFGKQYVIKCEISRVIRNVNRDKAKSRDEKINEILKYIKNYYENDIPLENCVDRFEYLSYSRNMQNGVISGFIASAAFVGFQYFAKISDTIYKQLFGLTSPTWIKLIAVVVSIIIITIVLIIPAIFFVYSLVIYCFRIFYIAKNSLFSSYERSTIMRKIKERYDIDYFI